MHVIRITLLTVPKRGPELLISNLSFLNGGLSVFFDCLLEALQVCAAFEHLFVQELTDLVIVVRLSNSQVLLMLDLVWVNQVLHFAIILLDGWRRSFGATISSCRVR